MKRNVLWIVISIVLIMLTLTTHAADGLTGDEKYSCEALLCLSSGQRPSECDPSLEKYYSIKSKKRSRTIKKRKAFLNICPTGHYEGRSEHIAALAAGSGRCDMGSLLSYLNSGNGLHPFVSGFSSQQRTIPKYCQSLFNNPYVQGYALPVKTQVCNEVATPFGYTTQCTTKWVAPSSL